MFLIDTVIPGKEKVTEKKNETGKRTETRIVTRTKIRNVTRIKTRIAKRIEIAVTGIAEAVALIVIVVAVGIAKIVVEVAARKERGIVALVVLKIPVKNLAVPGILGKDHVAPEDLVGGIARLAMLATAGLGVR